MFRPRTITSGKSGVGKTPLPAKPGISCALFNRETCNPDADTGITKSNLILGMDDVPLSLHKVLAKKADTGNAVYEGPDTNASRAFKQITAPMTDGGYKEETGEPTRAGFIDRPARAACR